MNGNRNVINGGRAGHNVTIIRSNQGPTSIFLVGKIGSGVKQALICTGVMIAVITLAALVTALSAESKKE